MKICIRIYVIYSHFFYFWYIRFNFINCASHRGSLPFFYWSVWRLENYRMGLAKYGYIDLRLCWTVWLYSISFWTSFQDFRLVRLIQPTSHSDHILEICWIHWGWIHPDKLEHVISALVLVQWLMWVYCNRPSYSTNSYISILFSTWTYSSAVFLYQ